MWSPAHSDLVGSFNVPSHFLSTVLVGSFNVPSHFLSTVSDFPGHGLVANRFANQHDLHHLAPTALLVTVNFSVLLGYCVRSSSSSCIAFRAERRHRDLGRTEVGRRAEVGGRRAGGAEGAYGGKNR